MEVRVVRGADDEMVPAVLNGGDGVLKDGEVGRPSGREVTHGATVPDDFGE
jgi:hypothetical protein